MSKYCLIKPLATEFKRRLKSGEINPDELSKMSSADRHKFFADFLGEDNAKNINSLFESKLLLKSQQQGMLNWAKTATGLKPAVRQDLITRIGKMDKILNPAEESAFLQDLASTRIGTNVSFEEAQKITELSGKVKATADFKTDDERIQHGLAKMDLSDYVNALNPRRADLLTNIANLPRSVVASFDLSAPWNQGWGMMSRKEWYSAVGSMLKYAKSPDALRRLQADILTRPTYEMAKKAGLRLTGLGQNLEQREEEFMSTLIDKIPGFSASERAYVGFLNKLRIDVFDDLIRKAVIANEDIGVGTKAVEDIAKMVNNFTGGARVGKAEGAVPILNAAFFSPRKIASTLNIMNPVNYINPNISKTARLAATRNLIGSAAITAAVIGAASILTGKKPEVNASSSDFGKIRVGDSTLDVSGGNANYATLIERLRSGKIKSPITGISKDLGGDIGQTSKIEIIGKFLRNKLSPLASLIVDSVTGENSLGEPKTVSQSVIDRFKPMFANSVVELIKNDSTGNFSKAILSVLGLLGAGLNTYTSDADWSTDNTKAVKELKTEVDPQRFKELNQAYNDRVAQTIKDLQADKEFQALSDEDKQKRLTKEKTAIKQDVISNK